MPPPRRRLADRLRTHGAPFALPPLLDAFAERWAGLPPRVRTIVLLAAALAALAVAGRGAATSPWGPPVQVVVATTDLPAGRVLTVDDLVEADWPRALVPPAASDRLEELVGRSLGAPVVAGSPVSSTHVAEGGLAAGLPPGHAAVALPAPEGVTLRSGQHIDLLAGDGDRGGVRLASTATVVAADETTVWVGVRREDAAAVAGALAWGEVTVALLPEGPGGPSDRQ